MKRIIQILCFSIASGCFLTRPAFAQMSGNSLQINVLSGDEKLEFASVRIPELGLGGFTDSLGHLQLRHLPSGMVDIEVALTGFFNAKTSVLIQPGETKVIQIELTPQSLKEVVITGTMKATRRADSPIPVEIITPKLFQRNPSPNLFEAVGMLSGIQPVIGCNVCNTGDIHINGMEGAYTMVLIDGMPMVSGLGTVYGLMGIPNSLIEQIEVVRGPAGALYGSEAMGGMINVITKSPGNAPRLSLDVFTNSWGETNVDAGARFKAGKKVTGLLGLNAFGYQRPRDDNDDGFTDLTLQKRVSIFQKYQWRRPQNRLAQIAARYVWEDRWGGQMNWTPAFRGGDSIYGESIQTQRLELFGAYQWPLREKIITQYSFNSHHQNSVYGNTPYIARQDIAFVQSYWDKTWKNHSTLIGAAVRWNYYNDNTPATATADQTWLPGIFAQDEWSLNTKNRLLTGIRADYHPQHGMVYSPRLAFRHSPNERQTLRMSAGSGFRVVNLFTEDHAALTGARTVVVAEALRPEESWGGNLNWNYKIPRGAWFLGIDATAFYTYFSNRILADYDTDPNLIIYDNLRGNAQTRGITLQFDYSDFRLLKILAGVTYMDVFLMEPSSESGEVLEKTEQIHAPRWSGTWSVNYSWLYNGTKSAPLVVDLTGNWFGPQRLPILPNDFRPEYSPWFALVNLQVSKKFKGGIECYTGVKNLLNFVPKDPIMRPFDPFDRMVDDPVNNPNGYTFDPSYNFAPLQGRRWMAGLRWTIQ